MGVAGSWTYIRISSFGSRKTRPRATRPNRTASVPFTKVFGVKGVFLRIHGAAAGFGGSMLFPVPPPTQKRGRRDHSAAPGGIREACPSRASSPSPSGISLEPRSCNGGIRSPRGPAPLRPVGSCGRSSRWTGTADPRRMRASPRGCSDRRPTSCWSLRSCR